MPARINNATFQAMQKISSFKLQLGMNPDNRCMASVITWFFYITTHPTKDHLPSLVGNTTVTKRNQRYQRRPGTSGSVEGDFDTKTKNRSMFLYNKLVDEFTISEGFGEIVDGLALKGPEEAATFRQKIVAKNHVNLQVLILIYTSDGPHALGFFHSKVTRDNYLFDPNIGQYQFGNGKIIDLMSLVPKYYDKTALVLCQWLPS